MEAVFEIVGVLSLGVVSALLGAGAANKSLILEFCAGGYQSS